MFETARLRRSNRSRFQALPALTPLALAAALAISVSAHAAGPLPTGGQFVAGTGSINGNATSLTVNQTSTRGIIDWNSFSIGSGNHVDINNGAGATLNRVTGSDPSSILGSLSSTGSVYLINPQGIVIGRSGIVSTGGRFVASTLDVGNDAFMNGDALTFSGAPAASNSTVVNLGKIRSSGGDVFLIASKEVDNVGSIRTPNGTTELAAGQTVLLHDSTDSQQVFVQSGSGGTVVNRGTIKAAQISLQAADGNVYALAGNHSVLRATGTKTRDGHVWLVADTGRVWMDGKVEAHNADGSGGIVDTNAATLRIAGGPRVKAGQWNITTPSFTIDGLVAPVFQSNLDRGTSINLQTTGAGGASGDIDVASSIHWVGAASLTLGAYHSLTIEAAAYLKNCGTGNLTLRADAQGTDNGGSVTNNGTIDWTTSRGIVGAFYDMNGTYTPGKMLANTSWTSPAYSGLVTQITGYKLVNSLSDLENVGADLAGNYALGKDIDASATSDGSFVPIGKGSSFTGQFDGEGHTISSLSIQALLGTGSDGSPLAMGLFDTLGTGSVVRNLNVNANTSISSYDFVSTASGVEGILAAYNYGTVVGVSTSGSVSNIGGIISSNIFFDNTQAGGLVGQNHGTIERSSSSATVTTGATLGGLVGENDGLISQSYASGPVQGFEIGNGPGQDKGYTEASPGALVGTNNGLITQSYATSSVSNPCLNQSCSAGALVYANNGTITQSFAAGAGPGPSSGFLTAYGIAVTNSGTIASDVYWNKDTTGTTSGVGSGTAVPASNGLSASQMSTASSYVGYDFGKNGVWAMPAGATHPVLQWQLAPATGG
ncbi:filamentous hemagglutinin N-terminal domain-containing protein [Trinickia sp. NRRL B-1857]|uniref:two-partner secretion domain-containing protein n=1 Tax=Trinickia sp. NRRL B-1857 TaxID=3162879 RepID=UPI003D2E9C92